jgi:aldehyde:ferredoxin oxidoreductase
MNGYNGRILRVNLSTREMTVEEPSEAMYRRYLGCSAMAAHYLLKEVPAGVDPLGPENKLIFMTSVITGTNISGANRYTAAAKSPLTGGFGEAEAGGFWGPELKAAGYDGIIIEGQSETPGYLFIHGDQEPEIRDASAYWGKLADAVQHGLEEEIGDKKIRVLQTGVAGENLVRYAAIVNQQRHFHGRAGLGAVMGAKKLKAIVTRGKKRMDLADKDGSREVFTWFKNTYDHPNDQLHRHGTARGVIALQADGILPTRNFRQGNFERFEAISGQTMSQTILANRGTCFACAVACKREVEIPELDITPEHGGPEYETIAANGSLCGVGDLPTIALANKLLAQYVLDSISTGVTIAFAMECYENGLLTKADTDGIELTFGNGDAVVAMIEKIGTRQGLGDLLAEGVKRAAEKIGPAAEPFALHVKGQELPMHEPRGKRSLAIAYATSPTGADHMEAPHDPFYESFDPGDGNPLTPLGLIEPVDRLDLGPKKVKAFFYTQQVWGLYNAVGMCDFVGVPINDLGLKQLVDYVRAVTGWDTSLWELLKVAERSAVLARAFNVRHGFSPADDTLPDRMFEPLENGPLEGAKLDRDEFQQALRLYYQMAGWNPDTGFPTEAKLAEMDLEWVNDYRPAS